MSFAFDVLQFVKTLRAAGVSQAAAEAHAEALGSAVRDSLVTKADLNEGLEKLRSDMLRWFMPLLLGQAATIALLVELL